MAQATYNPNTTAHEIARTFTIEMPLEDLALFWSFTNGTPMSAGLINGHMEITVDPNINGGNHWVSDIWIDVENHRLGSQNKWSRIQLNGDTDENFMMLVMDAIEHQYSSRIENTVQDQLSVARYERAA